MPVCMHILRNLPLLAAKVSRQTNSADLGRNQISVVLVRYALRKFAAYTLDISLLPDLTRQSPELFGALGLHA